MNTPTKLAVPLMAGALLMALAPSLNATVTVAPLDPDHPAYRAVEIEDTTVLNPANWLWVTQGTGGLFDDEPVWVSLKSATTSKNYQVSVTSTGAVVAGMDVYRLVPVSDSPDRVTPACPQGLLTNYLYPGEGESAGAYLQHLVRLTTVEHQSTVPGVAQTVSVVLDGADDYMLIVDGRLGSGQPLVGQPSVTYSVSVPGGAFDFSYPPKGDGDRPPGARLPTWAENQDRCFDEGVPVPPGIPEQPPEVPELPPIPDIPEPPSGAAELPGLGVDLEDLFAAGL